MNALQRYCRARFRRAGVPVPPGIGPIANSGEGGFDKARIGRPDGNRSIQYAGARFTVTPMTAARCAEAEVKFAQGAKPGKGGQLPGKKVAPRIARQRGCEPGYELVSPPVNHNLYSIEDVKLMVESWRHLNPDVNAALKFVATHGVEMACMGGVNAGANRLHLSDGCGGTGAAKRVDQKHGGVPVPAVLPAVQDMLVEEGVRERVEVSVDGGVLTGEHALKLMLLGADRVGYGTALLMAVGCSMLRQCHLAGPQPGDTTGKRRQGCTLGVATQDPALVARFAGKSQNVTRLLRHVSGEVRALMAANGIRRLSEVIGRRDLLEKRTDLVGKAALLDVGHIVGAPPAGVPGRDDAEQRRLFAPKRREQEEAAARRAVSGEDVLVKESLTNVDRCVGVGAAGIVARRFGDAGLPKGRLVLRHRGAAGHFYGAYAVHGMELYLQGLAADSAFTAAYGGKIVVVPEGADTSLTVVGQHVRVRRAGRAGLPRGPGREPLRHLSAQEPRGRGAAGGRRGGRGERLPVHDRGDSARPRSGGLQPRRRAHRRPGVPARGRRLPAQPAVREDGAARRGRRRRGAAAAARARRRDREPDRGAAAARLRAGALRPGRDRDRPRADRVAAGSSMPTRGGRVRSAIDRSVKPAGSRARPSPAGSR